MHGYQENHWKNSVLEYNNAFCVNGHLECIALGFQSTVYKQN